MSSTNFIFFFASHTHSAEPTIKKSWQFKLVLL